MRKRLFMPLLNFISASLEFCSSKNGFQKCLTHSTNHGILSYNKAMTK